MKTIVINNPAAKFGGALSILKEVLEKIIQDNKNLYYVIVSVKELKKYENENVKIYVIKEQNFLERILWDNIKLKLFLKKNLIYPDIFYSYQNTGVNIDKKIPQIIYYHQALSLSNEKWNFFKKTERSFWVYKKIYPFFVKFYLNRTKKVIVQTEWIKDAFSKKFKYSLKKIEVNNPKLKKIDLKNVKNLSKNKFRIFYPASPFKYKNHDLILNCLEDIKEDFECIFTFFEGENKDIDRLIQEKKLKDKIRLVGKISYEKVLEYYKSSDLLVFPSSIETCGLPLLEAIEFELSIIAADKPYSREITKGYEKIKLLSLSDEILWKMELEKKIKNYKLKGEK